MIDKKGGWDVPRTLSRLKKNDLYIVKNLSGCKHWATFNPFDLFELLVGFQKVPIWLKGDEIFNHFYNNGPKFKTSINSFNIIRRWNAYYEFSN